MHSILAIDAAWTPTEPTGVALLDQQNNGSWQCLALAPSYSAFINLPNGVPVNWHAQPAAGPPNPTALLNAAQNLLNGRPVSLVTVDMPVATVLITGRRVADNAISKAFGNAGCGTHSPTPTRPGNIGLAVSNGFAEAGYPLATATTQAPTCPRLVEVYPHPALLALTNAQYRLPYKVSKSRKYWQNTSVQVRIENLLGEFQSILRALGQHIMNIPLTLPAPQGVNSLSKLKRFEDALDALICGWVGTRYLAGHIDCYGDPTAAIWTP